MTTSATHFLRRTIVASALLLSAFQALAIDLQEERWNAYGQFTYIWQNKDSFPAAYTNFNGSPNSLLPVAERSFTMSATAFLGLRASKGAEIYFAPELISELPLSDLRGLGGSIQNGELEKNGSKTPTPYVARAFLRQTWGFGGAPIPLESGPLQLGGYADSRRFVLTAGKLTILDIFDKNSYTGDVRQQLMNMNFLTYAAYDFAADARGYSWGLAGEYYQDDWAFRLGRFVGPKDPNQLPLDFRIMKYFGDQLEIEHNQDLYGKPGKVRLLAFRNVENMGRWDDAINAWLSDPNKNATTCTTFNYGSGNASAPDLCWAPRKRNVKFGFGMSLQQAIADGVGVFLRGMKANGTTEVYSYTSTDSSISLGSIIKGNGWGRTRDMAGIGYAQNWLSSSHVTYLGLGGIDGFIGDGRISYRPEKAFEWFYNINLNRYLWFTLDFQHIVDPAYNSDRGPVNIYGVRVHAEI
jgi:hypothetical protein